MAAALADAGTCVFARAGVDAVTYGEHIHRALDSCPDLVVDDGGDLVDTLSGQRPELVPGVRGGCESTSTGVLRLRRMAAAGALAFPMVATDATTTKRMFDNTAGTGQSVLDAVLRATNVLLAGRTVVVAGFGPCGQGIAGRASGLGAQVIVTEVDPVRALEAVLSGYQVLPMREAAAAADVIVTVTGSRDVVAAGHLAALRDGAILANAGHFDAEIDVRALAGAAVKVTRDVRPHADEYTLDDGRRVVLLAEGRVVNLVAAEGNPPQVMDVSFAGQALVLRWLARDHAALPPGVHGVPPDIDEEIARLTLESSGARIDTLTDAQRDYLNSWRAAPTRARPHAPASNLRHDPVRQQRFPGSVPAGRSRPDSRWRVSAGVVGGGRRGAVGRRIGLHGRGLSSIRGKTRTRWPRSRRKISVTPPPSRIIQKLTSR